MYDSYGRLSRVPETGELEKVETQHADNRKLIERLGGVLGEELSDGLSAWKRSVRRPSWERLLERVESGASDGVVVWHTDRLFRQPRDLEKLIELGERGLKVASAHGERDLADPDDRFILRIEVAHAARSSDDTSRRIRRRFAAKRAAGQATLGGPRRFGFAGLEPAESAGGPEGERLPVPDEQVAREREAIRDAARSILAGGAVAEVARRWNAAGLRTVSGQEWVNITVRTTLLRPALAGIIEHDGAEVGRIPGEPVLDEQTWRRVRAFFLSRKRGRVAGERYLASGILRCGVCHSKLSGTRNSRPRADGSYGGTYLCSKQRRGCGRVYVNMEHVDRELMIFTLRRLSDARHASAVAAAAAQDAQRLSEVRTEITRCEGLQAALSDRLGRRQITLDAFDAANEPLVQDLARLIAERDSLAGGSADGPTEALGLDTLRRQWEDGDNTARRAMLSNALGSERMVIMPSGGKRVFDRNRMRLRGPHDPDGEPAAA